MITRLPYQSGFEIFCNNCPFSQEFQTGNNWQDFIDETKEAGWYMRTINEEWHEYCPTCAEKMKAEQD